MLTLTYHRTECQVARAATDDSEQARHHFRRRVDEIRFRVSLQPTVCSFAGFADRLPEQHEDGFASGLRVASSYLGASPPFEIKHAERDLTSTRSDAAVFTFLTLGESLRRILEKPFSWLLLALVLASTLADGVLNALGGVLQAMGQKDLEKRIGRVRRGLREVELLWHESMTDKTVVKAKKQ